MTIEPKRKKAQKTIQAEERPYVPISQHPLFKMLWDEVERQKTSDLLYEGMQIRKSLHENKDKPKPITTLQTPENIRPQIREALRKEILIDLEGELEGKKHITPMNENEFLEYIKNPENLKRMTLLEKTILYIMLSDKA